MSAQIALYFELSATEITFIIQFFIMRFYVFLQVVYLNEAFLTNMTQIISFVKMDQIVDFQAMLRSERLFTLRASVGFFSSVYTEVSLQVMRERERASTLHTLMGLDVVVDSQVVLYLVAGYELATVLTWTLHFPLGSDSLFSCVDSQVVFIVTFTHFDVADFTLCSTDSLGSVSGVYVEVTLHVLAGDQLAADGALAPVPLTGHLTSLSLSALSALSSLK